jgi:hypothetical protein
MVGTFRRLEHGAVMRPFSAHASEGPAGPARLQPVLDALVAKHQGCQCTRLNPIMAATTVPPGIRVALSKAPAESYAPRARPPEDSKGSSGAVRITPARGTARLIAC